MPTRASRAASGALNAASTAPPDASKTSSSKRSRRCWEVASRSCSPAPRRSRRTCRSSCSPSLAAPSGKGTASLRPAPPRASRWARTTLPRWSARPRSRCASASEIGRRAATGRATSRTARSACAGGRCSSVARRCAPATSWTRRTPIPRSSRRMRRCVPPPPIPSTSARPCAPVPVVAPVTVPALVPALYLGAASWSVPNVLLVCTAGLCDHRRDPLLLHR